VSFVLAVLANSSTTGIGTEGDVPEPCGRAAT
jgi:hypothetical protein